MRFVPWLVVGRIEVIDAAFQAGVHDREILIGKGHVDDDIGTEGAEEFAQFGNAVGIDLSGLYAAAADRRRNGVALRLGVRLASITSEKIGLAATFCVTTVPTPPAPMIKALHI